MIFWRGNYRAPRTTTDGVMLGSAWVWQQRELRCHTDVPHGLLLAQDEGAAGAEGQHAWGRETGRERGQMVS